MHVSNHINKASIFADIQISSKYSKHIKINIDLEALIISTGYHSGISKELAQRIKKEGLLNPKKKVYMFGITTWNSVAGREILIDDSNNSENLCDVIFCVQKLRF